MGIYSVRMCVIGDRRDCRERDKETEPHTKPTSQKNTES